MGLPDWSSAVLAVGVRPVLGPRLWMADLELDLDPDLCLTWKLPKQVWSASPSPDAKL